MVIKTFVIHLLQLNRLKRLLLPILTALALPTAVEANWFGRYGSFTEAKRACDKWANDGINYKTRSPWGTFSRKSRFCQYDKETMQFLGWEYKNVEENKIYVNQRPNSIVTKRFYF